MEKQKVHHPPSRRRAYASCLLGALLCVIAAVPDAGFGQTVSVVTVSRTDHPVLQFAALELESALREVGLDVAIHKGATLPPSPANEQYRFLIANLAERTSSEEPLLSTLDLVQPPSESYAIRIVRTGGHVDVVIVGRDLNGTLYGTLDAAEQVTFAGTAHDLDRVIRDRQMSPAVPIRGWRLFLQHQAFEDPFSWYHTEEYWQGLLDQLTRNRINVLELHGVLELITTKSYSLFPYLYYDAAHPAVGVGQEAAAHNLRRLQRIQTMASERGVRIFLVSNQAKWSIPDRPVEEDATLEAIGAYTQAAIQAISKACPLLEGIGFRLGESGRGEAFYRQYFLPALENNPQGAPILTLRSWGADRQTLSELAKTYQGPTLVETKMNGDHLGLPYPVTGGQMLAWSSHGYQNLLNAPRPYDVLFEVRTAADHQIFAWGDPVFVRRAVQATTLAGAVGFCVEAPSAYLPQRDVHTNTAHGDLAYYRWAWEKHWTWPLLWGRFGYDPNLNQEYVVHQFNRHFFHLQRDQAAQVMEALGYASMVIPAISTVTCRGPAGREYAPELEPGPSLDEFLDMIRPLDSMMFLSVQEEIEHLMDGSGTGKVSCRDFMAWAQEAINRAVTLLGNQVATRVFMNPNEYGSGRASLLRSRWQELEALYVDFQALQKLCSTIRWRLEAAYHLGVYRRSGHYPSLQTAAESIQQGHEAWKTLVAITTRRFHPFHETRRMQSLAYHWAWNNERLADDLAVLQKEDEQWRSYSTENGWETTFGHLPARRIEPGKPLAVTVSFPPNIHVEELQVRYRTSSGGTGNLSMGETETKNVWSTTIPETAIESGQVEYFVTGMVGGKRVQSLPFTNNRPYVVPIGNDGEPPRIEATAPQVDRQTGLARIELIVDDVTGVKFVHLWHKPLASDTPWVPVEIPGEGTKFSAVMPAPPEGTLYCIEAVDVQNQGTMWPNIFVERPYKMVQGVE